MVDGVLGLLPTLVVDIGVCGPVEETVMLFPTVLYMAGFVGLIVPAKCCRAVLSIVITFPSQAESTPFYLLNVGSPLLKTQVLECLTGRQSQ